MSARTRKQMAVITSVVVGVISAVILGVAKNHFKNNGFFRRIFQFQSLGIDSMKDFLEISELNLRVEAPPAVAEPIRSSDDDLRGHEVKWDADGSKAYTIFIASEYLGKLRLLFADNIADLQEEDAVNLQEASNWIRKIHLQVSECQQTVVDDQNGSRTVLSYRIPFEQFNCRIRSENGRVSRHLQYPDFVVDKTKDREIDAWLVHEGDQYSICIRDVREDEKGKPKSIHELQVVIYLEEGRGAVRTVPPFKNFIKLELGALPSGLCYLTGIRSLGTPFEQFVAWIGERNALSLDGRLRDWEGWDIEELSKIEFEI